MTDKEKTEEDKFRQTLQDACSFSDEQLLRDLEKAEKALGEFEFSGAEERIFKKLMEREAMNTERMREEGEEGKEGEEKAAEKVPGTAVEKELKTVPEKESVEVTERVPEVTSQKEPEAAMVKAPGTASVEISEKVPEETSQTISEENTDKALGGVSEKISEAATERVPEKAPEEASEKMPVAASQTTSEENADKALGGVSEKISEVVSPKALEAATVTATGKGKVLRFVRRKRMLMVALVAAFVGMLGAKAVGGNSYVFRPREKNLGVIMNNGRNYTDIGDLNEAYEIASQELQIKILRLGYVPKNMEFLEMTINKNKAVFVFKYGKKKVHVFQIQRLKETSFDFNTDREREDAVVYNKWLDQNASIWEETIDSQNGYSAVLTSGDGVYYITGAIPKKEIKKLVESLNFY